MNKICTSIEQSKKLIELGIDVNTADMYYDCNNYGIQGKPEVAVGTVWSKDIPAWSLAALLGVMKEPELIRNSEGKWLIRVWYYSYPYSKGCYDDPVDACVDMIEKLHELNKL